MKITVYNKEAKEVSKIDVPKVISGTKWNPDLVHQVVVSMRSNKRSGLATAKTRSEVRGGGKKPWRQKGTGRARHGSIRSPIWIGGGVTHGPTGERNYEKKINKKMQKKALYSVLAKKIHDKEVIVIDKFSFESGKTKDAAALIKNFENSSIMEKGKSKLILMDKKRELAVRSCGNVVKLNIEESRNINALNAMENRYLLVSKDSIHGVI